MISHSQNDPHLEAFTQRFRELKSAGVEPTIASSKAGLELKIKQWPKEWGNTLQVFIYGDSEPPERDIDIQPLGITIQSDVQKHAMIKALCVLKAKVQVKEKSVDGIEDAARRINILLGTWCLLDLGNNAYSWWSWITHNAPGGILRKLDSDITVAVSNILQWSEPKRRKVEAAVYWIREARNLVQDRYRRDELKIFAAYWNAFEILVEALNLLHPQKKKSNPEKQRLIDEFIGSKGQGRLTIADVQKCYLEIVNPGFVGKACHVLRTCFPDKADDYINECFKEKNQTQRLYDIRNAINHGEVDANSYDELIRIEARGRRLRMIVFRMFRHLIGFPY